MNRFRTARCAPLFFRRLGVSAAYKAISFGGKSILFVPQYEIAIYDGPEKVVLSKKPTFLFYYLAEDIALNKWDELIAIIEKHGLYGLSDFIRMGDPQKQRVVGEFPNLENVFRHWDRRRAEHDFKRGYCW